MEWGKDWTERKSLIVRTGISRTKSFSSFSPLFLARLAKRHFESGLNSGKGKRGNSTCVRPAFIGFDQEGEGLKQEKSFPLSPRPTKSEYKRLFSFSPLYWACVGKKWASHHLATFFWAWAMDEPIIMAPLLFLWEQQSLTKSRKSFSGTLFSYGGAPVWALQVFCLQASRGFPLWWACHAKTRQKCGNHT